MGKLIRNGNVYGGSSEDSININYDNSSSGLKSKNMQEAVDELWEKFNFLNSLLSCKEHECTTMDALRAFFKEITMNNNFGVFSLKNVQSVTNYEGNFIGVYFSDRSGNYTFVIRDHWGNKTFVGEFSPWNEETNYGLAMHEVTTSLDNVFIENNAE